MRVFKAQQKTRRRAGWVLLCIGMFAVLLPSLPASAVGETLTVAVSMEDGTPTFNVDDVAGHDSSANNGIVRTNDNLVYAIEVLVADANATNVTITMELAQGTELTSMPPFCGVGSSVTPATMPAPAVPTTATSWTTLPRQTVACNVGSRSANSTFVYPISARVRPEMPNGQVLDTVTAVVTSDDAISPAVSTGMSATVSARAQFDISKNAMSLGENDSYFYSQIVECGDGSGRVCMSYNQAIMISAPFGGKGSTPLASPLTFTDDLSVDSIYPAGTTSDPDYIAAGATALAKYGARLVDCTGLDWMSVYPRITGSHTAENSVRNSGSTTCTQPGGPGTPVSYTVTGLDSTAYTSPTLAARPPNTAVPGDAAFVYAGNIRWELPAEAVVDLGIATPAGSPDTWSMLWNNRITNFAPVGIDGIPADPATDRATNNYRRSSFVVTATGSWSQFYSGTPNAFGNKTPTEFSPGWAVWEGPSGSTGSSSGEGQLYPGETTISSTLLSLSTATTQSDTSFLGCNSWDNSLLQLTADNYEASTSARLQSLPSNGEAVWIAGYYDGVYYSDPALVPALSVEYGTGLGGSGAASTCADGDSPAGWFSDPAAVPGNDPALAATGVYTAVTRVRMHLIAPPPATAGGPYITLAVGLRAEPSLPTAVTLPVWATGKLAFGTFTMAEMRSPSFPKSWGQSSYNPSSNSGNQGDRLRTSRAIARIRKEVKDPNSGVYGTTTPQYTGGQTAEFRITPTLTAGVSTPATVDTVVEDCLPAGVQFQTATVAPTLVQPSTPPGANLTCAAGESYIRWDLGPLPINQALTPIEYTVKLSAAIVAGTKINTTRITAVGDSSAATERTATASMALVQPAGVVLDKAALTPLVEVNRVGETVLDQLAWRVVFANLETSPGPTDIDIIDVLPQNGLRGSSFSGGLAFDSVTVTEGSTVSQPVELLYTSAPTIAPDANDPTNDGATGSTVWCDAPSGGAAVLGAGASCPATAADVTGVRVRRAGAFGPSDSVSFTVTMTPSANQAGDVYVNTAAGRGVGLALLTGPVSAPEQIIGSSIGDKVFLDADLDGIQDAGEIGVADIWVRLVGTDSDGNTVAPMSVQTGQDGTYSFMGLQSGDYTVTFDPGSLGAGQEFTRADSGADDLVDSDGNPATGVALVSLLPNTALARIDQGIIEPVPSISLVKRIDGDDAQTAPGVEFAPGDSMTVTFEVTNTGNTPLGSVDITDSHIDTADISCPPIVLAPGALLTCTATAPAPAPGFQHTNTATASATPQLTPAGTQLADVSATDVANAFVTADAQVAITKYVVPNGQQVDMDDANSGDGLAITVNGIASWFYEVSNPGNAALSIIDVVDDNGTVDPGDDWLAEPVVVAGFNAGDTNQDGLLDVGEVWRFASPTAHNLTVTEPVFTSSATVTAAPTYPAAPTLTATDIAIHHGQPVSVSITKLVQTTEDANTTPGPLVAVDAVVVWTYIVTNDGAVDLVDLVVTDDQIADDTTIDCGVGNNNVAGPLAPGSSFSCSATGVAIGGQYTNTGAVDAVGPTLPAPGGGTLTPTSVRDEDPASYFGSLPSVELVKYTQAVDADTTADQPLVTTDDTVAWTYVVTNTGTTELLDVAVVDDQIDDDSTIICAPDSSNVVPVLAAGDTISCVATAPATQGQYQNTGTVTARGPDTIDNAGLTVAGLAVTDENPSHYFGIDPQLEVVKTVQTLDANEAPGPMVATGDVVRWNYTVTNVGNVALSSITLIDDIEGSIDCPKPSLAPDESMDCSHDGVAGLNAYLNIATAAGTAPSTIAVDGTVTPGAIVEATDLANHFAADPAITIIKKINGADANTAPGLSIRPGAPFDFTYEIINNGNVLLSDIAVSDDKGVTVTCPGNTLEPTMKMVCTGSATAPLEGSYVNTGLVTASSPSTVDREGNEVAGEPVSDADEAHAIVRSTFDVASNTSTLAFTGASSKTITLVGLLVILAGLALLFAGKRNRAFGV